LKRDTIPLLQLLKLSVPVSRLKETEKREEILQRTLIDPLCCKSFKLSERKRTSLHHLLLALR
jgi:hypothetical protein